MAHPPSKKAFEALAANNRTLREDLVTEKHGAAILANRVASADAALTKAKADAETAAEEFSTSLSAARDRGDLYYERCIARDETIVQLSLRLAAYGDPSTAKLEGE